METLKLCIAGEGAVGKTSFLNKVLNGIFDEKSKRSVKKACFIKNP